MSFPCYNCQKFSINFKTITCTLKSQTFNNQHGVYTHYVLQCILCDPLLVSYYTTQHAPSSSFVCITCSNSTSLDCSYLSAHSTWSSTIMVSKLKGRQYQLSYSISILPELRLKDQEHQENQYRNPNVLIIFEPNLRNSIK